MLWGERKEIHGAERERERERMSDSSVESLCAADLIPALELLTAWLIL